MSTTPSSVATRAATVMTQLVANIMTTEPMSVATLLTIVERLWFIVVLAVSTSLVTRESTSPVGVESR